MITENHKKAIIAALGKNHIAKIRAFALENNVRKDDGKEFSHSTFSHVLNGRKDNPVIEDVIFSAAEHYLDLKQKEQERRKEFVEKVNAPVK